ncbi:MFS transporter [Micromonospora chersina]|uniref:MFS transporter n=1 Tax=Micromonospora chersina TaxID=47854 RepID=UPI003715AA99
MSAPAAPATSVRAVSRRSGTAIAIFALLLLSYVLNAMDRQLFPLLVSDVREEHNFGLADAGLLSTVFTLGMGLAGIPTAFLMARLRRKTVVMIGIFVFSITTLLTALSAGFADMFIYRALSGLGEAMQLAALLAIATTYFTRRRAVAIGSINLSFAVGAAVSPVFGGALLAAFDWRMPLIVFGLLGIVAIALVAIFVRPWLTEAAPSTAEVSAEAAADGEPAGAGPELPARFLNRNTVLITIATVAGGLLIYGYLGMYPTYLQEELGFDVAQKSGVMSIFGLGAILSIVGGMLGDRFNARIVLPASFAIGIVLAVLLFTGPATFAFQAAFSFIWGAVISGTTYVNLAGYQVKAVRPELAEKASGLFIAALYIPAAFSGYLVGAAAGSMGWQRTGMVLIGGISAVGALAALFIRPAAMTR